jgi:hypothetical protein
MALINCSECGNKHSENADICPACGNPNQTKIDKKTFGVFGLLLGWIWILSSAYLIYRNWIILSDCHLNTNWYGTEYKETKIGLSVLSAFVPWVQIFGQSDAFPQCRQLFDENLIWISRVAIGSVLILAFTGWLLPKNNEEGKRN